MKRLILTRHAKSSWDQPELEDIDRQLNARGTRDAARIGRWLRDTGSLPECALVSVAARTRETWAGISGIIGARPADFLPELYHAEPDAMLEALRAATADSVILIGHQPGIGALAASLVAVSPEHPDFARYPTAATAVLEFAIDDWQKADRRGGRLVDFVTPRGLT